MGGASNHVLHHGLERGTVAAMDFPLRCTLSSAPLSAPDADVGAIGADAAEDTVSPGSHLAHGNRRVNSSPAWWCMVIIVNKNPN